VVDDEMLRRRRLVAASIGLLLVVIILFGGLTCASNRKKTALKKYNQNVTRIVTNSDEQVSAKLFELLGSSAGDGDPTAAANSIRQLADKDVKDAQNLDVPGEMTAAQRNLELVLNLRATGVTKIARDIGAAKKPTRAAIEPLRRISGQMQAFLASDVVHSQRVKPLIKEALADHDLGSTEVRGSRFLKSFGWLDYGQTAQLVNPDAGGPGATPTGEAAPGRHGHGLTSVTIGDTTLEPGSTPSRVSVTPAMALNVTFQNQGDNDESNVKVVAKVAPSTTRAYEQTKTVSQTKAGESANVSIPLSPAPTKGSTAKITVTIQKVPGEKQLENNTATYTVFFN
jgi:hypothetical protein